MNPLRARMIRDMTQHGFYPRTHESYLRAERIAYNSCRNRHCPKC